MTLNYKQQENRRIIILGAFFFCVFIFLGSGLFYRQIIQYNYFIKKEKYQNQRVVILPAPRGDILDRNGKVIVYNKPLFEVHLYFDDIRKKIREQYAQFVRESKAKNKVINRTELQKLARKSVVQKYLDCANKIIKRNETINETKLEQHYRESLLLPFTLISNLTTEEYVRLVDHLPSDSPLQIATDYYRYYPYREAACHVLGYVTSSNEMPKKDIDLRRFSSQRKVGKSGIELSQNDTLAGIDGKDIFSVDPSGFKAEQIQHIAPQKGKNCQLSIDIDLQIATEKAIGKKYGSAIAIEIDSGEVLAMANYPNYDVNALCPKITTSAYQSITDNNAWLNRALQGCYPPASTFKIISSIAFLRNHIANWDDNDTELCYGRTKIGPRVFNCDHSTIHGPVSLATALKKSCNVYYYLRSQICGIQNIIDEAKRFRLDQKTGIELPFETNRMTVPSPEWKKNKGYGNWFAGDTANASIGQGYLSQTPLQMACFIASVAANRTTTIPHIIHNPAHRQDNSKTINLRSADYQKLITTLKDVVDTGTGHAAHTSKVTVAGKSGTAQVWDHKQKRNVAWFIGFAPVDHPKIAVAVALQETSEEDNYYGGKTAAPVARKIFEAYF